MAPERTGAPDDERPPAQAGATNEKRERANRMDIVNQKKGKCGAEAAQQPEAARLDLGEVRERLSQKKGPEFWRSLDELAGTPEFQDLLHREFPRQATELEGVSRRQFLQLSGASLALAGLTGCTKQPPEAIVPYVKQAEQIVPGRPLFFATAVTMGGYAMGVLAESHMGRPTKLEGNPDHPASLGATDQYTQAEVLNLYDPERSQTVLHNGRIDTWCELRGGARRPCPVAAGAGRRGRADPQRHDDVADVRGADGGAAHPLPARPLAPLGAGRRPPGVRRGHPRLRPAARHALRLQQGGGDPHHRLRRADDRAGRGALLARLLEQPPGAQGPAADEPAVLGGERADQHRHARRPPAAAAAPRGRGLHARPGAGARRRARRWR